MLARLIALAAAVLLLIFPLQPVGSTMDVVQERTSLNNLDLPSALADDDSFDDLPFEQLRQALREEVERGPQKGLSHRSSQRYNLLIR